MDKKNTVHAMRDMEDLCLKLDYGVKALGTVVEGMRCGAYGIEDYADSVYGVYGHLSDIQASMAEVVESYFGSLRQPSEDGN